MVLTDEQEVDRYPMATMETGDSATENLYYTMLDATRSALPAGYPTDTATNPNSYVARLNGGTAGPKIGPGITLKVMAGDQFSIKVSSWYRLNGTTPGTPVNPLTDIVTALISGIGALPGGGHPSPAALQANSAPLSSNVTEFLSDTGATIVQTKPHAFINWILFDNQFNLVEASSGFDQVGADQELHKHILTNLPVASSGYLYIYTSNETPNVDVFFDNLQVTLTRGPLLEENQYYPFGLTMAGISDKAIKGGYAENKYRYNDKELQNKEFDDGSGLDSYDFGARMMDPQVGRWWQIDPLLEKMRRWSPYCYGNNDPINHIDIEGLIIGNPNDPLTKRIQRLLNATKSGTKIWNSLVASKRTFSFIGISTSDKVEWETNLRRKRMINTVEGETVSKTMFSEIKTGNTDVSAQDYTTFNNKTGKDDKTSDWDETFILINLDGIQQQGNIRAAANDGNVDDFIDAELVETAAHEGQHGLQDSYQFNEAILDPSTRLYKKGSPLPNRDADGNLVPPHEKNADFKGRQVKDEWWQFIKSHGDSHTNYDPKGNNPIIKIH